MQKILNKREKVFVFATFGLIIVSVVFHFLVDPVMNRSERLSRDIDFTRSKLKKYIQLLSQKDDIRERYSKLAGRANSEEASSDTVVNALSEIENVASDSQVRIIDMRPQNQQDASYKEVRIELRTQGAIEGYVKFIYRIENSLALLKIRRFQLTVIPNSSELEGSFSISKLSLD